MHLFLILLSLKCYLCYPRNKGLALIATALAFHRFSIFSHVDVRIIRIRIRE